MRRAARISILFLLTVSELPAQSWLSRQWHNSVAHYNYYYNANLIVSEVIEDNATLFKDNFKQVLTLYPVPEQSALKGNASKMDEVLKKCSHIIEKHSQCKWVDDSYLLMGDAQLYKGDFYAAIEVYEYVAGRYKKTIPAAQAEINLIKTYLLLDKKEDAEALYTRLSGMKDFPAKLRTRLDIAGAAVNIRQAKYKVAIKLLEKAIPNVKNKMEKVRYNFVLAQLYGLTNNNQQAGLRYRKVIKLNPPYLFAFHARLNMAKAINPKNRQEIRSAKNILRDMLRDDKNIEFFDQIYFELGNLEIADKNENGAIEEYTKSLRANGSDLYVKSSAYLALADLYFKKQDYESAQTYYDSAARTISPTHPEYQQVQDKNLVLNELIKHLVSIREKDSLLLLAGDEKLRERTIDKLIREEKERAEMEKQQQEIMKLRQDNLPGMGGTQTQQGGGFPFYNMAARTRGIQDFQRIWGARELMDFWAISSNKTKLWEKIDAEQKSNDIGGELKRSTIDKAPDERKKYYENIPFTQVEKQSMMDGLAESYCMGANVYYQSLREYDKAKALLLELLEKYPGNNYSINAWYLLARIYKEQKNEEKVQYYTGLIREKDPKSNFLNVLEMKDTDSTFESGPQAGSREDELYRKAYQFYKQKKYEEALSLKAENDRLYPGNSLQVNFDYLEALIIGEQGDMKNFQIKLQAVADNYPGTGIAEQAARTIEMMKIRSGEKPDPSKGEGKYSYNAEAAHFYMLIVPRKTDMTALKMSFLNFNKSFHANDGLRVTTSLLGDEFQILIVNNFSSLEAAGKYIAKLKNDKTFFGEAGVEDFSGQYLISKENFTFLITDKVLADYIAFYKIHYTF